MRMPSFWIVEVQGSAPLAQTSRTIQGSQAGPMSGEAFSSVLESNLGHMVNMGPTYAIGGVVTAGTGNDAAIITGLKLRARRWLRSDLSLEAEGGLLWRDGGTSRTAAGGTAALRLNIRDQGSFHVRWDMLPIAPVSHSFHDPLDGSNSSYVDPGGTQHALSIGIGTGSVPGLIATCVVGVYVVLEHFIPRD